MRNDSRQGQTVYALCLAIALTSSVAWAATSDDDALLKQAQGIFKPLPRDMGTAEYPVTPVRVTLSTALFRPAYFLGRLCSANIRSGTT